MRRGTIILIIFVLVVGAVIGVSQFLQRQPPVEFSVAVHPLAAGWARDAINAFNADTVASLVNGTQRVQFSIQEIEDLSVWQDTPDWDNEDHPAAWLPAASVSVGYSTLYDVVAPSVARTPLVWGGYDSRVQVAVNNAGQALDWDAVQAVAAAEAWSNLDGGEASWRFFKFAFPRADQTMSGLGVLFSSAAHFHDAVDISGAATRSADFREWLTPVIDSVPNFQTLGADPAAAMARGPSTVEIAMLPESLWLRNLGGLTGHEPVVFTYPAYQFMLDFPLAEWNGPVSDLERAAVQALRAWLTDPTQQAKTVTYGLRPAASEPGTDAALFTAAEPYGIMLTPDFGQPVTAPTRSETQGLVQWFVNTQRR